MICISCTKEVGLGKRVVVIPFPAAGEDCFLVAHPECCPSAVEHEGNRVGYFLEGSGRFFVPRERVMDLEPVEGLTGAEHAELVGPEWYADDEGEGEDAGEA